MPFRLMILQFLHIRFTDDLTFMYYASNAQITLFLASENDSPALQVVRRQFHNDLVTRKNFDKMHPHLPGDVGKYSMAVLQLHSEHGVWQRLNHNTFDFNGILFGHARSLTET
jgi:hypothetical protein